MKTEIKVEEEQDESTLDRKEQPEGKGPVVSIKGLYKSFKEHEVL